MTFKDSFKSFACKFSLEEGCRAALSYSRGKLNRHCHHRRTPGITAHNPTLFVQLKVEPLEQWNPGPSFKTCQPQRAEFAAWNSGTNTAVYNFSRFQLTIWQNRGIRCIGQFEIVESAAYSGFRGSDSGIRTSTSGIRGSDSGLRRLMQASIKMFVL